LLPCKNLGKIHDMILTRFWPPGISLPGENLAGICPLEMKIPSAKISPGSQQDPPNIPVLILQG